VDLVNCRLGATEVFQDNTDIGNANREEGSNKRPVAHHQVDDAVDRALHCWG
jgi:hypothetical protein